MRLPSSIQRLLNQFQQFSFYDTFKHASIYFSGTLLIHGVSVISLPIITAYLSSGEYGIVNVFTSYATVLVVLLTCNLHWSISRYYFEKDQTDFDQFLGTIFITLTLLFLLLSTPMLLFREEIGVLLDIPIITIPFLIGTAYLMVIRTSYDQILTATNQSKKFSLYGVAVQLGKFVLTFAGLIYLSDTIYTTVAGESASYTFMGKIIGELVAIFITGGIALYDLRKYARFNHLSFKYIRYALAYGVPLIPMALSGHLLTFFDQWYINSSVGHDAAGKYAFAYKIGALYLGLGGALLNSDKAIYFKSMNAENYTKVFTQVRGMFKLLFLGGGFLLLFAVDMTMVLSSNDELLEIIPVLPVMVGAYVFANVANIYNRGIYYLKKNYYLSAIILFCGIVNIGLNLHFIPLYNYQAAAYTTLASYCLMMLLSIVVTTYVLKLPPLPTGKVLEYSIALIIMLFLNYLLGAPELGLHIQWIAFKLLLFGSLAVYLFRNELKTFLSKKA